MLTENFVFPKEWRQATVMIGYRPTPLWFWDWPGQHVMYGSGGGGGSSNPKEGPGHFVIRLDRTIKARYE